jgi:hypothetical protein
MKKEVILQSNPLRAERYANVNISLFAAFKAYLLRSAILLFLSQLYSRILEMRITPLQAFHLTHAQVVFYLMIFPCNFPLLVRVLLMLWFFLTVLQCRHAGLK